MTQNPPSNIVIVPEGIAADKRGNVQNRPSFVYKTVLDFAMQQYKNNHIYLAPANSFGADFTEQELAAMYLEENGCRNFTVTPPSNNGGYIDTFGNALLLKEFLLSQSNWPLENVVLVSAQLHAPRARLCFESVGFSIKKLEAVPYEIPADDFIVKRLGYYKCKYIHVVYETLAFVRDFFRINFIYKTIEEIIKAVFDDKSLPYSPGCLNFTLAQIEKSPLHINLGLKFLTLVFLGLSCLYGFGRPFFFYKSNYRKITFVNFFEKLSKTSRMFISFIRSMSLIYACDNQTI